MKIISFTHNAETNISTFTTLTTIDTIYKINNIEVKDLNFSKFHFQNTQALQEIEIEFVQLRKISNNLFKAKDVKVLPISKTN
ncbi:hypothetical protein [Arcobacter sp. YIC-310]|uniref:hypothetical protein n=1 Tax=Arcobacter sp. YIC-310 TaxID=3376632 RepID=UPI003C168B01